MSKRLADEFGQMFEGYRSPAARGSVVKASARADAFGAEAHGFSVGGEKAGNHLVPECSFQQWLRPLYDKGPAPPAKIGDHPDFVHLSGTQLVEFSGITSLFMDLAGSTRLSRMLPLEEVFRIKNAVIRCAIEVVRAFDGHVHRIMGDAVFAFFGSKNGSREQGVIDGLNCASVLALAVKTVIVPALGDENLGVRIGLDYGADKDVLWSSYGYPGVNEVTATSFNVDVAAKLQQSAGRNKVMIGQSLKTFLDFPECLLSTKQVTRDGVAHDEPFVLPNYTDKDGRKINYRQFELDVDGYLAVSPLAGSLPEAANVPHVVVSVHNEKGGPAASTLVPTGVAVAKERWLRFHVRAPGVLSLPLRVDFEVENHGDEASSAGKALGTPFANHSTSYKPDASFNGVGLEHWESTAYRGLHFQRVAVFSGDRRVSQGRFGVYVV